VHPISGVEKLHSGIDIGVSEGTDVLASKDGTVVTAGWNNGYGYYVTINHGDGIATLYAHNSSLLVKSGDKVSKGQAIAKSGSTGNSTGPHIHFEIIINGETVDPSKYF
jgi:murein DD-endopeptidase MepM/ murein hydrolase activator NlpD